jgi:hypothetical protein
MILSRRENQSNNALAKENAQRMEEINVADEDSLSPDPAKFLVF